MSTVTLPLITLSSPEVPASVPQVNRRARLMPQLPKRKTPAPLSLACVGGIYHDEISCIYHDEILCIYHDEISCMQHLLIQAYVEYFVETSIYIMS